MKKSLVAAKPMKYGTRSLVAGDPFEASSRDARLLIAIGKAKAVESKDLAEQKPANDPGLSKLRQQYQALARKKAPAGWDAESIVAKIAELTADKSET